MREPIGCYVAVGLIVVMAWVVAYLVGRWVIGS